MPYGKLKALGACCAVVALAAFAPVSAAGTINAGLRVVTTNGKTLADQSQLTGDATIPTDPGADCFGPGTGGSGNDVHTSGPNALGLVQDASQSDTALRPLSVTDYFSFGLGVCGIGGFKVPASSSPSWYLKVN